MASNTTIKAANLQRGDVIWSQAAREVVEVVSARITTMPTKVYDKDLNATMVDAECIRVEIPGSTFYMAPSADVILYSRQDERTREERRA